MPKPLPTQFAFEKDKTAASPFNALLVQFPAGTVAMTDQSIVGATLQTAPVLPIVKSWGTLDGNLNLREGLPTLSAIRISGLNYPGTGGAANKRFSDLFPASTLEATFVSMVQCFWVSGIPGGTLSSFTFFKGVIRDPVEYTDSIWSFEILSLFDHYLGRNYGVPANQNDFPMESDIVQRTEQR